MFTNDNPNQLTYENQILNISVLGGIRLEGLDRLRVTLSRNSPYRSKTQSGFIQ